LRAIASKRGRWSSRLRQCAGRRLAARLAPVRAERASSTWCAAEGAAADPDVRHAPRDNCLRFLGRRAPTGLRQAERDTSACRQGPFAVTIEGPSHPARAGSADAAEADRLKAQLSTIRMKIAILMTSVTPVIGREIRHATRNDRRVDDAGER